MIETKRELRQLSLGLSHQAGRLVMADKAGEEVRRADYNAMQASLHSLSPVWPHAFAVKVCPHPLIIPQSHLTRVENVHQLLCSVVTYIIERWWSDDQPRFPARMPLEQRQLGIVQVIPMVCQ